MKVITHINLELKIRKALSNSIHSVCPDPKLRLSNSL